MAQATWFHVFLQEALIVDEINADIQSYGKKYSSILFIVYDLGSIQDETAFKHGLETVDGNINVIIVKH